MKQTKIITYPTEKAMQKGIQKMQRQGWEVHSTQVVQQGYSFSKTCCLAVIFLPLALLGRKPNQYQVTYQK